MPGLDLSGEVLDDRYQIFERLSEGAMGVVYRGIRIKLDRQVAIKVMHAALPAAMNGRERFEREAQLMAKLDHPHVVSIIDYGIHRDHPYVVMELVRGMSLHDMLVEQGRFEIPRAVDVIRQVLSGLAHAHEQGVIHRDIKPANIMITPKAPLGVHARILDFGLARMLGAAATSMSNGLAVGTPSYMAPEQCRGDDLDARVDIYACGIVLFEMLTGKKPLTATDPIQTVKKQLEEMPPLLASIAPGSYGPLEGVVARALAKAPADRYPSAAAMAEALEAAVAGRSAADTTAVMKPARASEQRPPESSLDIPITVASSAFVMKPRGREARPVVRPIAPSSKRPYLWLALLLITAGVAGAVVLMREPADDRVVVGPARIAPRDAAAPAPDAPAEPPPDRAAEIAASARDLAATGQKNVAFVLLAEGRRRFPDSALLPLTAGKLYFAQFWWTDGLANLREAIRIDPSLKQDPDLIATAVDGFITTPSYDGQLARFVLELGPAAAPRLDEVARTHRNPEIRARAAALARRLHE